MYVPNMGQLSKKLAKNIRKKRGEATKRDFAKVLGISKSSLHRIEMNEQNVGLETLELFCKRLKCQIGELFE